jgi:integrase
MKSTGYFAYRGWASRFARCLHPRNPRPASGSDVKASLADLAKRGRVQDLMGHASVETTQIYLHVMKKPGMGVQSPLDRD